MRKKLIGLTVICVLLSILFVASGCSLLNRANSESEAYVEKQEVDALTRILDMMKRREPSDSDAHYQKLQYVYDKYVYIGDVNYQINYEWKDVNLDVLDYSQYYDFGITKEDIEETIALSEEQGCDCYVSDLKGVGYENVQVHLKFDSISEIGAENKIYYNEGHSKLNEENEVIIPKWLYFHLYCTTLEEITCDMETLERVLADDSILQRDMFLGLTEKWSNSGYSFSYYDSLAISLGYYGIIDTSSPKYDMQIIMPEKFDPIYGYGDKTYELSVVGYFETELDKYFNEALTKGMYDYGALIEYLNQNTWVYFK